CRPLWTACG
nr:Chain A, CYS-ARG-PRO-LEU-TRP-THR-ALA-CYS-GLY [Homo sapiens]